jgi:hypothetical protein
MPRLHVERLSRSHLISVGRLARVKTAAIAEYILDQDYDSAEQIMTFLLPSVSRKDVIHMVQVDALTGECLCSCEAMSEYREAGRMPYRRDAVGTMAEHMARQKKQRLLPLIVRPPRALCGHIRRVREWVRRHDLLPHFNTQEQWLIGLLEDISA